MRQSIIMKKIALVFPGQGSQSIGMLADLAKDFPVVNLMFDAVSDVVGYDVWALTQTGPKDLLDKTAYTQVAMLTADVAVFKVLEEQGLPSVSMMAGHSLGEYAALVCARVLSLQDAARLVKKRGNVMQEAVSEGVGAMAAIVGLTDEQVLAICSRASLIDDYVAPANYNAIGQVVIAGHTPAVMRALQCAEEAGARLAKCIPVSVPCHCSLLKDAAEIFSHALESTTFNQPIIPVMSNVDLSIYHSSEQIKTLLKEQLYRPVRWVETIQAMQKDGIELIIECGPGTVLGGLIKRIDRTLTVRSVNDTVSLNNACEILRSEV